MKYIDLLKVEDLPGFYQMVIETIGLEATIKLASKCKGRPIYLMDPNRLLLPAKKAYIRKNFTGGNHYQLAFDTDLSLAEVYKVLADAREKRKQGNLFENNLTE